MFFFFFFFFLRKDAKRCKKRYLSAKRVVYGAYDAFSESMIVAACHNTSIGISEKFKSDKKVRWLSDMGITRCEFG